MDTNDSLGLSNIQIRDGTISIATPSLQGIGNEVVPDELIQALLNREWYTNPNLPKPYILIQDEAIQVDLKSQDLIMVSVENYQEQPTGHRHEFVDVEVPLILTIKTIHSRQRMWNIMAEIRRIVYKWFMALQPYHMLYFDGFQPDYEGVGLYGGTMRIRCTAGALPIFSRRWEGMENLSTDPSLGEV